MLSIPIVRADKEVVCRICLSNEDSEENPFFSPCVCDGSVKYCHLTCLQHWINSKSTSKLHGMGVIYHWKSLNCEICHSPLPGRDIRNVSWFLDLVLNNQKPYYLIDPPKPESSYIMIESIGREKPGKTCYIMMGTDETTIKIVIVCN